MTTFNVTPVSATYSITDLKTHYALALAKIIPVVSDPHPDMVTLYEKSHLGQRERETLEWLTAEQERGSTHIRTTGPIVEKQFAANNGNSLLEQVRNSRAVGIVMAP